MKGITTGCWLLFLKLVKLFYYLIIEHTLQKVPQLIMIVQVIKEQVWGYTNQANTGFHKIKTRPSRVTDVKYCKKSYREKTGCRCMYLQDTPHVLTYLFCPDSLQSSPRICIANPSNAHIVCCTSWHLMYALIVCFTSWQLMYTLIVCCMSWHLMYALIVCCLSCH